MLDPVRLRADRLTADRVVLTVSGEVDLVTAPGVERAVAAHLGGADLVVLDLSDVTFFGSFGLATLIRVDEAARERGTRLALVVNRLVLRTMDLTATTDLFTLHETLAEALES